MRIFNYDTRLEKAEKCIAFFQKLTELLDEDYEVTYPNYSKFIREHCSADGKRKWFYISDHYLIPSGTRNKVTYYEKPKWSFRISDHWNWIAPQSKCTNIKLFQCFNVDLPIPNRQTVAYSERKGSEPVRAYQVAIYGDDEAYHCVYGAYKDKKTHSWMWMDNIPEKVISEYWLN